MWYNEYSAEWTKVHVCQFEQQQIVLTDSGGENNKCLTKFLNKRLILQNCKISVTHHWDYIHALTGNPRTQTSETSRGLTRGIWEMNEP